MSDARLCPYDGKKLRSDNTKGICSVCQVLGRTLENAPATPVDDVLDTKTSLDKPKRTAAASALKRFRVVAEALGEDPNALIEAFAESWLGRLKERAAKLVELDTEALRKQAQADLAPKAKAKARAA
mgnify:CR=1 FL=1